MSDCGRVRKARRGANLAGDGYKGSLALRMDGSRNAVADAPPPPLAPSEPASESWDPESEDQVQPSWLGLHHFDQLSPINQITLLLLA